MTDNFRFDITGASLEKSLEIAFSYHNKATHWVEAEREDGSTKIKRLILLWTNPTFDKEVVHPFPSPITVEEATPIVRTWLLAQNYGSQPDHDGDNQKGWRVYNEAWGQIVGHWEAFVAIEPVWLMYGK